MSEATTTDHAGGNTAGRHRGAASAEEAERTVQPPLGKPRWPALG
jgi:hypothetical protein